MKFLFNYCVSLLKKYLLHLSRPVSFIIIQKYSGKKWIFFVYYHHVMCKVLCIQHASNVSIIIQTQTKNHFDVKKYFFFCHNAMSFHIRSKLAQPKLMTLLLIFFFITSSSKHFRQKVVLWCFLTEVKRVK